MPFVPINAPGLYPSMMRILKRNGTYFLLKRWALSIPLATTQCQSLRQTTFTSIKIILCPDSAPLLITFFSSVATLTQSLFALNASVSFSQISSQLQTQKFWLSQKSNWIFRTWRHRSGELPRSIKIRPYRWLDTTPYREILILLHWSNDFLPLICSLFWDTIEAIAEKI